MVFRRARPAIAAKPNRQRCKLSRMNSSAQASGVESEQQAQSLRTAGKSDSRPISGFVKRIERQTKVCCEVLLVGVVRVYAGWRFL